METENGWHATVLYLLTLIGVDMVMRHWEQIMELRGIEQATIDREFWELVNDGAG